MNRSCLTIAVIAALALSATGCDKLKARDNLNKGVQAFKSARYQEATTFFLKSVELEPDNPNPHLYLATAYMSQYIPGAESDENNQMATNAEEGFGKVLALDPQNELAIASIASLKFNQKKFGEATEWNKKLIAVNPQNKDAYYTLGVIAWTNWLQPNREARIKMNMKPEDPGPLKDKKVRDELGEKYMATLDEGITNMQKALDVDPEYDEAMAYMNLLIRYRADLLDTPEEYQKAVAVADEWVQKALATKKMKAERQPVSGFTTE